MTKAIAVRAVVLDSEAHCSQAYEAMQHTPRWRKNGGKDYVFYDPHPGMRI